VEENWADYCSFKDNVSELSGDSCYLEFRRSMHEILQTRGKIAKDDNRMLKKSKDRLVRDKQRLYSFNQLYQLCEHM
jgi:ABC-type phosphate transport system auxiliary subunit